jgi:hypothetical protein
MIFGYNRMAALLDNRVKATTVLDAVSCYGVYQPLKDDLFTIAQHLGSKSVDFPYDWRKDIITWAADQLALAIASYVKKGSPGITLVGHSMGNLVARMVLESGLYSNKSWFSKITKYVGICGPHFGVPRILEYALGLKGSLGVFPADMQTATADPRYPSVYQCLPDAKHPVLWDISGLSPQPQNLYTKPVANKFNLCWQNLLAAQQLHNYINFQRKPPNVQYVLIAGSDQTTDERTEYDGLTFSEPTDSYGDGMIPIWSSAPYGLNPQITPGDHIDILKSYPFRQILYEAFTGGALSPAFSLIDKPGLSLSLNDFVFKPYEPINVLMIFDLGTQDVSGTLQINRAVDERGERFLAYREQSVVYRGPEIRVIRSTVSAPADPGAYQMTFTGSHGTSPKTASAFVVSKAPTGRRDTALKNPRGPSAKRRHPRRAKRSQTRRHK